jgi:hypothetical protein
LATKDMTTRTFRCLQREWKCSRILNGGIPASVSTAKLSNDNTGHPKKQD